MSTIVLAHGFNVKDGGKKTIDKLLPFLNKHAVLQADYGFFNLFGVRFFNKHIARVVAGMTPYGSIGIGHSNGCDILVKSCNAGAPFSRLILINPALDRDTEFPLGDLVRVDVLHNVDDHVVDKARLFLFHPWGDMGRVGYQGKDARVRNHETKSLLNVSGHSEVFDKAMTLYFYLEDTLNIGDSHAR